GALSALPRAGSMRRPSSARKTMKASPARTVRPAMRTKVLWFIGIRLPRKRTPLSSLAFHTLDLVQDSLGASSGGAIVFAAVVLHCPLEILLQGNERL